MKLIYIAHPYGGKKSNVTKATDLANRLTLEYQHYHIFNAVKYFYQYKDVFTEEGIKRRYLDMVLRCSELWLAPGWEESAGCRAELDRAIDMIEDLEKHNKRLIQRLHERDTE